MTQEIQAAPLHVELTLTEKQKSAWLSLAVKKNQVVAELQKHELAAQGLLLNIKDDELAAQLAEYRKKHKELIAFRREFTAIVERGLIDPLMEFEKRVDPQTNATYLACAAKELQLRAAASDKLKNQQAKADEIARFDAHFRNEFSAIAVDYRQKLANIIHQCYVDCLYAKTPVSEIENAIGVAKAAMNEIKLLTPASFTRVHIDQTSAKELYAKIPKINTATILEDYVKQLADKFEMYANDLANADRAAKQEESFHAAEQTIQIAELHQEQAANTLMAAAQAFVMPEEGFKGITETTRIIILDESQEWVLKIVTSFIKNFGTAFSKLRVKKYSQLKVEQMANALDEAGVKVEGVGYETIRK